MDDPLREAHEKRRVVQGLLAVRLLKIAGRIMQKHDVEIRAIPEFQAAEFAVGHDDHSRGAFLAIDPAARFAVAPRHLEPGQLERRAEHQLGDVGQAIADLHQW